MKSIYEVLDRDEKSGDYVSAVNEALRRIATSREGARYCYQTTMGNVNIEVIWEPNRGHTHLEFHSVSKDSSGDAELRIIEARKRVSNFLSSDKFLLK